LSWPYDSRGIAATQQAAEVDELAVDDASFRIYLPRP
jgi:hypothetical protein